MLQAELDAADDDEDDIVLLPDQVPAAKPAKAAKSSKTDTAGAAAKRKGSGMQATRGVAPAGEYAHVGCAHADAVHAMAVVVVVVLLWCSCPC